VNGLGWGQRDTGSASLPGHPLDGGRIHRGGHMLLVGQRGATDSRLPRPTGGNARGEHIADVGGLPVQLMQGGGKPDVT
jgi:hypothetical protein